MDVLLKPAYCMKQVFFCGERMDGLCVHRLFDLSPIIAVCFSKL
jgi:hypothetical protein